MALVGAFFTTMRRTAHDQSRDTGNSQWHHTNWQAQLEPQVAIEECKQRASRNNRRRPKNRSGRRKNVDVAQQRKEYLDALRARQESFATGLCSNALLSRHFGDTRIDSPTFVEVGAFVSLLHDAVKRGDLGSLECLLASQAVSLNALFTTLGNWAAENIEDSLPVGERLLRLAFKAQSQCRATIESLAMMKNPASPVFARQANIAHGPQQVNNRVGVVSDPSRAESENAPNELLEAGDGERLDAAAASEAGEGHQAMATVDAVHRPAHGAREGDLVHERIPRRRTAPSAASRARTPGAGRGAE